MYCWPALVYYPYDPYHYVLEGIINTCWDLAFQTESNPIQEICAHFAQWYVCNISWFCCVYMDCLHLCFYVCTGKWNWFHNRIHGCLFWFGEKKVCRKNFFTATAFIHYICKASWCWQLCWELFNQCKEKWNSKLTN